MLLNQRIAVVMPAYNAAKTLEKTIREAQATGMVDDIILVDDASRASRDGTADLASSLTGVSVIRHPSNRGYGGNQKTCYRAALDAGADIVIMVHPDYQYTPRLILAQILFLGRTIAEVSCPTVYFPEASSINFRRSVTYGFGCLRAASRVFFHRLVRTPMDGIPLPPAAGP